MIDYEKLGLFYLGRKYDLETKEVLPEPLLYESRNLTTHAVCVGMTGSGKTGLCLSIIEEAAIDGLPVLAIDPKGDLGNLLLTFPELRPDDFQPWIDPHEAARNGQTVDQYAEKVALRWREGLAAWDQEPARIKRFRDAVDLSIYTPGSSAGLSLSVLRSLHAPSSSVREDGDLFREHIQATAAGVLALVGIAGDSMTSREHLLLGNLIEYYWKAGKDLDLSALIDGIQKPPFKSVGRLDIEAFYPASERFELSVKLNNLVASPAFAAWVEGDPLDIDKLLYREGKPRVSILSIAHLSETERMSFVTILLSEVLSWVRSQPGTSSLRALLYMDEVFGFFPPSANPPSKRPMLTLLKQARAYGLGIMLATQNPVDLDYKGLSNAGTWFLGRLQTERDKMRVLDGLEGASLTAGSQFDRKRAEAILSSLGNRVFLMNNVHDDQPTLFQSRWALSYLRGPLTRDQIQRLMAERKAEPSEAEEATARVSAEPRPTAASAAPESGAETLPTITARREVSHKPILDPAIPEFFARPVSEGEPGEPIHYVPCLHASARLHYVDTKTRSDIDQWVKLFVTATAREDEPLEEVWARAWESSTGPVLEDRPASPHASYAPMPAELARGKSYATWTKRLKDHLYRERPMPLWYCSELKLYSWVSETEQDFRVRVGMKSRERRDEERDRLRAKFRARIDSIENKIRVAEERVTREHNQASQSTIDAALTVGGSILDVFRGKGRSRSTATKAASRAARQRGEAAAAADSLRTLQQQRHDLELEIQNAVLEVDSSLSVHAIEIKPYKLSARKTEISVEPVSLVWFPRQNLKSSEPTTYV